MFECILLFLNFSVHLQYSTVVLWNSRRDAREISWIFFSKETREADFSKCLNFLYMSSQCCLGGKYSYKRSPLLVLSFGPTILDLIKVTLTRKNMWLHPKTSFFFFNNHGYVSIVSVYVSNFHSFVSCTWLVQ